MVLGRPHGSMHRWDMRCPIEAENNPAAMEDLLADRIWAMVSPHEANFGLEQGEPGLAVAKRVIQKFFEEGKPEQADALECIVFTAIGRFPEPIPRPSAKPYAIDVAFSKTR